MENSKENLPVEVQVQEVAESEEVEGLTIDEYATKYTKKAKASFVRALLVLSITLLAILLGAAIASLVIPLWKENMYLGIGALAVLVILVVLLIVVPLIKVLSSDYFIIDADKKNYISAKRHNKAVRRRIASHMIDITSNLRGKEWKSFAKPDAKFHMDELSKAVSSRDDSLVSENLVWLYGGPVKKTANAYIVNSAVRTGIYTFVSQNDTVDALIVATLHFQLLKNLVYIYGFRPTDRDLMKVFLAIAKDAAIAYTSNHVKVGETIANYTFKTLADTPIVGIFAKLVNSTISSFANGGFTIFFGKRVVSYLNKEYKIQSILDKVQIEMSDKEEEKIKEEVKAEIAEATKNEEEPRVEVLKEEKKHFFERLFKRKK
ncbi:MAG: DUF697 domain-containing protein [Bacilli bacterium]|nr:DUF697 domain-containing protein [Bacilli bacterium]